MGVEATSDTQDKLGICGSNEIIIILNQIKKNPSESRNTYSLYIYTYWVYACVSYCTQTNITFTILDYY